MKLLYVTSLSYPSKLANRLQVLSMAKSFDALLGESFSLGVVSIGDATRVSRIAEFPGSSKSPVLAWRYLRFIRREGFTHVYCREERLLMFLIAYARITRTRVVFFYESHWVLNDFSSRFVLKRAAGIVAITQGIKDDLAESGTSAEKICVAPDGVDTALFAALPSKEELRREYDMPTSARVIAYTGSFARHYDWKGVDTLLAAAEDAPKEYLFVLAGGDASEVGELRKRYEGKPIRFLGHLPHEEVPRLLFAADVLVLPNKAGNRMSERHTSPLKLFEYMASGTPIVASDLPSIREILSEDEAVFFTAGSPDSLQSAIAEALTSPRTKERALRAREKAGDYRWDKRAANIIDFLSSKTYARSSGLRLRRWADSRRHLLVARAVLALTSSRGGAPTLLGEYELQRIRKEKTRARAERLFELGYENTSTLDIDGKRSELVSIGIFACNRFELLRETCASLAAFLSRYGDEFRHEVLLFHDGENAEIRDWAEENPLFDKVFFNPVNHGLSKNINRFWFEESEGRYVVNIEDDWVCEFKDNFIENGIKVLQTDEGVGCVRFERKYPGDYRRWNEAFKIHERVMSARVYKSVGAPQHSYRLLETQSNGEGVYGNSCTLYRFSALLLAGKLRDDAKDRRSQEPEYAKKFNALFEGARGVKQKDSPFLHIGYGKSVPTWNQ